MPIRGDLEGQIGIVGEGVVEAGDEHREALVRPTLQRAGEAREIGHR
ncbi:hypothetical protein [Microbacterium sp.]|nr:hypothetical protein [Microbacterium sp.]